MLEVKPILCPIDFSEFSVRAYCHALSLAEHYRAKLVALHIVELWRYPCVGFVSSVALYDEFCQSVHEGAMQQLQAFESCHTHNQIQPELLVQQGMAPDFILSFAQAQKVDVIVMGTHGQRGYDRLMLGSVTDRVMRRAPCPVLVISKPPQNSMAEAEEQRHPHHLNRILFCTDFSENSERALENALSVREVYDAELTLLYVLEDVPSPANTEKAVAKVTAQLDKLIPEGRESLKIKTAVRIGKPYWQIVQFAEETKTDLVVMAVRGRGALDLAVFGSTTYRVMQLGPCPVLAVHV